MYRIHFTFRHAIDLYLLHCTLAYPYHRSRAAFVAECLVNAVVWEAENVNPNYA